MPRDPFKELQAGIDESFDARFAGQQPKLDLLSSFATSSSPAAAPQVAPQEDLLGAWAGAAAPKAERKGTVTVRPWKDRGTEGDVPDSAERPGQSVARWVAENQGDSIGEKAARFGAGALRGVGDVADTIAQGIAATGEGGANVLAKAGIVSPGTVKSVQDWRAGINDQIASDNALFQKAGGDSGLAGAGQIVGQIAGTAPLLGPAGRLMMSPVNALTRAAPGAAQILANPGNALRVGQLATTGAGIGAGTSALTSAASNEPLSDQIKSGGIAGAILGPLGAGAANLGARVFGGAVGPETAALARTARDVHDIPVGIGQISENPTVRFLDSVMQRLPFTGMGARTAEQRSAFNRAVSQTFGENTDTITHQTITNASRRIGNVFDNVAAQTPHIRADQPFFQHMSQVLNDARNVLPASEVRPLENQMRDLITAIDPRTHTFTGDTYQALTRRGAPLDRAIKSPDPNIRYYASQIREGLDDAMQRSAAPDVVQALREARSQWKALKPIESLAKKATTGDINPALLLAQANKSYTGRGGGGDLGELGRIGQRFLKESPSSGTAERTMIMQHLPQLAIGATGLGALGSATYFDPESWQRNALLGAGALTAGRAGGGILRSNALANMMINSSLRGGGPGPVNAALLRALPAIPAYAALRARQTNALANSP